MRLSVCQALRALTISLPLPTPHLQAVEAAAIVHLQEGKRTSTRLTTRLDPAANTQRLANLLLLVVVA